ncbi:MAG: hypothetical protein Q8Q25_02290 [bacterium]|nr:hypothetical protein [bacterium]
MYKKVLFILSLALVGNEVSAMKKDAPSSSSSSWSSTLGSVGASTFGTVGSGLDATSRTISVGLSMASTAVHHQLSAASAAAHEQVVKPLQELADSTQQPKKRGFIANAIRKAEEFTDPRVLEAKVGLLPLPSDSNYSYYKRLVIESLRFQEGVAVQLYTFHQPLTTDSSQTSEGGNQLTILIKRQRLTTELANDIYSQLQAYRNGPDREKRDAIKRAALNLRRSKNLTATNTGIMAPIMAQALKQQRSEVRPLIQRQILERHNELAKELADEGYIAGGVLCDYDSSDEEGDHKAAIKALFPLQEQAHDVPADDSKEEEQK